MTEKKAKKGASSGCKPGTTRRTYVMPVAITTKLKAIAGKFGKSENSLLLEMIDVGISDYESKYGPEISHFVKEI